MTLVMAIAGVEALKLLPELVEHIQCLCSTCCIDWLPIDSFFISLNSPSVIAPRGATMSEKRSESTLLDAPMVDKTW